MPVITHIARQLFSYPFFVKVWEKATAKEAKAFFTQRQASTTKIASMKQTS
jgi:hypothetical protein